MTGLIDGKYFMFQMEKEVEQDFNQQYDELLHRFAQLGIDASSFEFEAGSLGYEDIKFNIEKSTGNLYAYYRFDSNEKHLVTDLESLKKAIKNIMRRIKILESREFGLWE